MPAVATHDIAPIARALGDPVRVRIVEALRERGDEVCQCHLQPLFAISQPTLSHHLGKLVDAGLVTVARRGRWAHYAIDPAGLAALRAWLA
jgi:ArsR family transcriptional regulator